MFQVNDPRVIVAKAAVSWYGESKNVAGESYSESDLWLGWLGGLALSPYRLRQTKPTRKVIVSLMRSQSAARAEPHPIDSPLQFSRVAPYSYNLHTGARRHGRPASWKRPPAVCHARLRLLHHPFEVACSSVVSTAPRFAPCKKILFQFTVESADAVLCQS